MFILFLSVLFNVHCFFFCRLIGEPGNSRGHLSNLGDRLSSLNSGIGSRNLSDSCGSAPNMGPPSYASVNIDLSLNTLTSLVPAISTGAPESVVYTLSNHQIPIGGDKNLRPATSPTTPTNNNCVPNFLRPQRYLHSNRSLSLSGCVDQLMARNSFRGQANASHFFTTLRPAAVDAQQSRSLENLVLNSAEIGQSSAMTSNAGDNSPELESVVAVVEDVESRRHRRTDSGDSNKSRQNSTSSVI